MTKNPTKHRGRNKPIAPPNRADKIAKYLAMAVAIAAMVYFLIWPPVVLSVGSFRTDSPLAPSADWSVDGYTRAFQDSHAYSSLFQSFFYALVTAAVALTLGLYFASRPGPTPCTGF